MDDVIKRSDAIEAIEEVDWYHQNRNGDMVSGAGAEDQAWYKAEDIYKALEAVPSADRPSGYIHIDDVYRLVAGHSDYHGDSILSAFTCLTEGKDVKPIRPLDRPQYDKREVKGFVEHQPSIDIVRCQDCRHWVYNFNGCARNPCTEPWYATDFCSYGERKDQ